MASREIINIGSSPNDGSGDSLRTAFTKINNNFSQLWNTASQTSNVYTLGTTTNQVLFETPVATFTEATFQVHSFETTAANSQTVNITASINNDLSTVKFSAFGTTFNGGAVTNYAMDISGANVRLLANPLSNDVVRHLVISQVNWIGPSTVGMNIALNGYATGSFMITESGLDITTQQ